MGMGMSRFPDPYETRDDLGHATVFLVALLILIGIAAILFYGNAWLFAPVNLQTLSANSLKSTVQVLPTSQATTVGPPTFTAPTPVPPLAGIPIQTPQSGSSPAKPPSATPTPRPSQTAAATPYPTERPSPTPTKTSDIGHVANTGGDGVYLRHTPKLADKWVALPDNTSLVLLGAQAEGDGEHWVQVRDSQGDVGWVPSRYVAQ